MEKIMKNERTNKQSKNSWMNWVQLEKMKKTCFPSTAISCSGNFRKYWELLSIIFYVNKNKEILQLRPMKLWKNCDFRHISNIFPFFWPEKKIPQKSDSAMFCAFLILILVQKIRKNKWWNLKKVPINWFFRHIFSIFGRKNMFFERRALSLFRYCHFASTVCKISWKNIK